MKKLILISLFIIKIYFQDCSEGCLQCGENNVCLLCDSNLGYIENQGVCNQKIDTKCFQVGKLGHCELCNENYYYQLDTEMCKKVDILIPKCIYYSSNQRCKICEEGYFPLNGGCFIVTFPIKNCKYYLNEQFCQECQDSYILSNHWQQCVKDDKIKGCKMKTNVYCNECEQGYTMEPNSYINIFNKKNFSKMYDFFYLLKINRLNNTIPSTCQKGIDNCQKFINKNQCEICNDKFFLTEEKQCEPYPYHQIINCIKYKSKDFCLQCNDGYFLIQNNSHCEKHKTQVEKCLELSQSADSQCIKCEEDYYVQGNKCSQRSFKIKTCQIYQLKDDKCEQCIDSYLPTTDMLNCLPLIPNCKTYNNSQKDDTNLTCNKCTNGKFYDSQNNTCNDGPIENCFEYSDQSTCSVCQNEFYLNGNKCLQHDKLSNCLTYSQSEQKTCDVCMDGFFNFKLQNVCMKANTITGCYRYEDLNSCEQCYEGYILSNKSCTLIPDSENCLRKSGTDCTKCKPLYYLNTTDKKCYYQFFYQLDYCQKMQDFTSNSSANENGLKCSQCIENYFFKDLSDKYVCLNSAKIPTDDLQNNCIRYKKVNTKFLCQQCQENYTITLDAVPKCSNTCDTILSHKITLTVNPNNNNEYQITDIQRNVCDNANYDQITKFDNFNTNNLMYGRCKSGIPLISSNLSNYDIQNKKFTYGKSYQLFQSCATSATAMLIQNQFPPINDPRYKCLSYFADAGKYYCKTCQHGYTGKILEANNQSYTLCDTIINDCEISQIYGGFIQEQSTFKGHQFQPSIYYSCHKCYDKKIPFLFTQFDNEDIEGQNFKPYDLSQDQPDTNTNGTDKLIQCLEPKYQSLKIETSKFTKKFPDNCGLAAFNVDQIKNFIDNQPPSIYCVECAPGYKKIVDSSHKISSCSKIDNCNNDSQIKWFNTCSQCQLDYAWNWETTKGIDFAKCVKSNISYCLVYNQDGKYCKYCKKGFNLTADGKCDQFQVGKCQKNKFQTKLLSIEQLSRNTIAYSNFWLISYLQDTIGCDQCENNHSINFVSVKGFQHNQIACVTSYQQQNEINEQTTDLIYYCECYSGIEKQCMKCKENYILKDGGKYCVSNKNYMYCKSLDSSDKCIACEDGYFLINEKCVKGTIPYCQLYENVSGQQKCKQCESMFRPTLDKQYCIHGNLENCSIYENQTETSCNTCMQNNIFKYKVNNSQNFCFKQIEEQNCETYSKPTSTNSIQEIECSICKPGYYKSTNQQNFNKTLCHPYKKISHCLKYSLTSNYFTSDFKCIQCEAEYYVSQYGYFCNKRDSFKSNCLVMEYLNQECKICQEKFYLENGNCYPYPTGVEFCLIYTDSVTCEQCITNFYLKENQCLAIEVDNLLPNCVLYNSQIGCVKCEQNFVLDEFKCIKPVAINCLTFKNVTACETCSDNYFLSEDVDGIVNCIFKNIDRCVKINYKNGDCMKCDGQYYINEDQVCLEANYIPNCIEYESKIHCKQCTKNFYLTEDKKYCIYNHYISKYTLDNCNNQQFKEKLQCLVCEPGMQMVNGECQMVCNKNTQNTDDSENNNKTEKTDNTENIGCYICNEKKECLVCQSGYYQKENNGECIKIKQFPEVITVE